MHDNKRHAENVEERYDKSSRRKRQQNISVDIRKSDKKTSKRKNYSTSEESVEESSGSSVEEGEYRDNSKYDKDQYKKQDKHSQNKRKNREKDVEENYENKEQYRTVDNIEDRFKKWSSSNERRKKYENLQKNSEKNENKVEDIEKPKQKHNQERMRRENSNFHTSSNVNDVPVESKEEMPASKTKINTINLKSGGAYIPPAKLKMLQDQIADKSSEQYQRLAWIALKKSLIGLTNKINISNIREVVREIFKENVVRGRGVLTRCIIQAQALSPTFTHIYAALVAVINSRFPNISELLLKRLLIQFKRGFRRNDKDICISSTRFIAHLLNQQVAHEVVVLEILTLLLENPVDDSVEIAIAMLKECGKKLQQVCSKGSIAIFDRLNHVLHEASLSRRVQYIIEVIFQVRKDHFKDFEIVVEELDLVEENDKFVHLMSLVDANDDENILNVFKFDPEYLQHEEQYKEIQGDLLDDEGSDSDGSGSSGEESDSEDEDEDKNEAEGETIVIKDMTETNIVALRRNIYLTIQSSLDFEECAHKLLKMEFNPGQIVEMCYMILDCCAQQRTYEKFFGLLAQRFCQLNKIYVEPFTDIFKNSYETIHRLETNKLRNVAKFFAHLLYTDAISWLVLANIKLNETNTTSSSRIFIKILFQDLAEFMGLKKLFERVKDVTYQEAFDGLFPRDNPQNTRFAINFFTSIGLGGLTDELREHLKAIPKKSSAANTLEEEKSSSETDSSSSSSSSSSDSSSSSSESEDSDRDKRRHKRIPANSKNKHKTNIHIQKKKKRK